MPVPAAAALSEALDLLAAEYAATKTQIVLFALSENVQDAVPPALAECGGAASLKALLLQRARAELGGRRAGKKEAGGGR